MDTSFGGGNGFFEVPVALRDYVHVDAVDIALGAGGVASAIHVSFPAAVNAAE